jgi:RimJ/RimL family protein N-acetyltransferase
VPPPDLRARSLLVPLASGRLDLQPLRAGHADALYTGLIDPSLYRYETERPPADLDALRTRFAQLAAGSGDETEVWLNWVAVRRDDGVAVGYVQATVAPERAEATVGYLVLRAYQQRGFGREAAAAMCDHLGARGVKTLHAWIDVRNTASVALAEALRFERVSTGRSVDVIGAVRGFDHHYVRSSCEGRRRV